MTDYVTLAKETHVLSDKIKAHADFEALVMRPAFDRDCAVYVCTGEKLPAVVEEARDQRIVTADVLEGAVWYNAEHDRWMKIPGDEQRLSNPRRPLPRVPREALEAGARYTRVRIKLTPKGFQMLEKKIDEQEKRTEPGEAAKRAIGILWDNPDVPSLRALARQVGCSHTTLSNNERFKAIWEVFQRERHGTPPAGAKDENGNIEAWKTD